MRLRPLVLALVLLLHAAAGAQDFSAGDATSLFNSILAANQAPGGTITLTGNITLTQSLPMIAGNVTINGNGYTIDANSAGRVFFIEAGTVAIANVTIANALAQGGAGGAHGGGGGLGAGAALFVNSDASVVVSSVQFVGNRAVGGNGAIQPLSHFVQWEGGGGGMAGNGGNSAGNGGSGGIGGGGGASDGISLVAPYPVFSGGGGGGLLGAGGMGSDNRLSGHKGSGAGGGAGGNAAGTAGASNGGFGGGGGGSMSGTGSGAGGGGGPNGGMGADSTQQGIGMAGNGGVFGGGGGGAYGGTGGDFGGGGGGSLAGGNGGFGGGGGGSVFFGGNGGFGGGGGGAEIVGRGGFGGGNGYYGGGGGAGFGGAVFVRSGGSLTIEDNSIIAGNTVAGGLAPGAYPPQVSAGMALGSGIFVQDGTIDFDIGAGQTATIDDAITDGYVEGSGTSTSLAKTGAGILVLNGVNAYAGGTTINAGTLVVGDATHPSAVTAGSLVVNNGTLRGFGTVTGAVTNTAGIVAPGGSIGTLTVGSFAQGPAGTLAMAVAPGAASRLVVLGSAALDGTLNLAFARGYYPAEQLTLVQAASLSGDFAAVTAASGIVGTVGTTATAVDLAIPAQLVGVAATGATPNAARAASVLNAAFGGTNGTATSPLLALGALAPSQQQTALTQISGVAYATVPAMTVAAAQAANGMLLGRVLPEDAGGGDAAIAPPVQLAFGGNAGAIGALLADARRLALDKTAPAPDAGGSGVWLQGAGNWGSIGGDANAPGASSSGGGVMGGYDLSFGDGIRLGVAVGYGSARSTEDDGGGTGTLESWRVSLYGGREAGPLVLAGAVGYALDRFTAARSIAALGVTAQSSHYGGEISGSADAGYRLRFDTLAVTPFVSADYVRLSQQGFTESDAGALGLTVAANRFASLQPEIGVRVARHFTTADGTVIEPVLRLGVRRELLDTTAATSALLTAATSSGGFSAQGVSLDRTIGDVGVRVVARLPSSLALYVGFDARISGRQDNETLGLGLRGQF